MFLVLLAAMMLDLSGPDRYWMALDSSLQTWSSNDIGKKRTADVCLVLLTESFDVTILKICEFEAVLHSFCTVLLEQEEL